MANIQFFVELDLIDKYVPAENITVVQESFQSVEFFFDINKSGSPVDLTGATDFVFALVKPDGHVVLQNDATLTSDGKVKVVVNPEAFTAKGKIFYQIQYKIGSAVYNTRQAFAWVEQGNTSCQALKSTDYAPFLDQSIELGKLFGNADNVAEIIASPEVANSALAQTNINTDEICEINTEIVNMKSNSSRQDGRIGAIEAKNTEQDVAIEDANKKMLIRTQSVMDKHRLLKKNNRGFYAIHNVGDSISQGANSDFPDKNSWAGIIRKSIQTEYNTTNHGYVNFYGMTNYVDITTSWTNGITGWVFDNKHGQSLGFMSLRTSNINAITETTFRNQNTHKFNRVILEVAKKPTAGLIEIIINGSLVRTVNCNSISDTTELIEIDTSALGFLNNIQVKNITGSNELVNIYYIDNIDDVVFNNYAMSGEKLTALTDSRIDSIFNCNVLFFSLGFNTVSDSEMDTIFAKCVAAYNTHKPVMYVNDFCWNTGRASTSAKLKKFAEDTGSVYIKIIEPVSNVNDLINSGFLSDTAHPTNEGHELIANKILNTANFTSQSKRFINKVENMNKKIGLNEEKINNKVSRLGDVMTGHLEFGVDVGASKAIRGKTGSSLKSGILLESTGFQGFDWGSGLPVFKYTSSSNTFDVTSTNTNLVTKRKDGRADLTLTADATNANSGYFPYAIRRGNTVTVRMEITRNADSTGTTVCTLPADSRPVETISQTIIANDGTPVGVNISWNGNIDVYTAGKQFKFVCTYVVN